jgi:adenylate cyclase
MFRSTHQNSHGLGYHLQRLLSSIRRRFSCARPIPRRQRGSLALKLLGQIVFNTAGDSVVADFASAVDAVQCAVAVQAAITTENAGGAAVDEPMQLRIGVHVGDIMVDGENLFGDGVNIAARLEALAEPGSICVSAAARDHIGNKLPLGFDDLGDQQVKNIAQAIRVYRVQAETPVAQPIGALPLPDKPSIAVLPFQNMSGDPDQEYFVDGMVEEIITALSRIRWLFVIARNSTFTYKGKAIDVKQVGRELGVRRFGAQSRPACANYGSADRYSDRSPHLG